jgi:hypothetical protein
MEVEMKMKHMLLLVVMVLAGCSSSGSLGMVVKSTADPGALLTNKTSFREIGPADGEACRYFLLGVLPFGKSDFAAAVDEALIKSGGDALLNVTVSSSLYGFIPVYNLFSYTCTNVKGIAVKFEEKKL